MVCSKALVVLLTIAIVQCTAALSANELHEKLKSLDSEKLQKLTEKLSAHLEKQNAGISVSELHEKIKNDAGLQQKLSEHIKQKSMQKMHEKMKAINPEALEKMKSKLSAHLEKQNAGISVSELHEKIKNDAGLQQKLSEHIKQERSKQKSMQKMHEKLKAISPEALETMKSKLSAHLEKQNAGISVSELHEKIKNDAGLQQKLSEHIKQKSMQKMHEKMKAINPEALETMKSKLSAHLEKQNAGISVSELHEKIKDDAGLQQKLSEHIKEKMSEKVSKRKMEKLDARAGADCSTSISDIVTQAETLVQDTVKIRSAGITILEGVVKCATGATTAAATCLSGVVTSTETDAQQLVAQIQQALTKIQTDVGKLASCAPTAG